MSAEKKREITMSEDRKPTMHGTACYRVLVPGNFPDLWTTQGDRLQVRVHHHQELGSATSLTGFLDQAALIGLLRQLFSLGLPILSVEWMEGDEQYLLGIT